MRATTKKRSEREPRMHRHLILLTLMIGVLAAPALLSAAEPISPLLDRYAFTLGSYFTAVDTDVQANETDQNVGTATNSVCMRRPAVFSA